jgi:P27 family predicted phage terminase small subunit
MRVLTVVDAVELEGLACWLALYRDARQHVRDEGAVILTEKNTNYTSPWYGVMSNSWKHFDTLACRFGLTPADRSKLQAAPTDNASEYEQSRKRS